MLTSNPDLRTTARKALQGKWGISALICLVYILITCILNSIPTAGPFVS